jgi:hypothetical protein
VSLTTLEPDIRPLLDPTPLPDQAPELAAAPPIFGKCPVCAKPLRPRCKVTGEPKCPPVGTGYESRAKCTGCETILVYQGNGEWRVLLDTDLTPEDHFANRMGF